MNYILNYMEIQQRHIQDVVMEGLIIGAIIHTASTRLKVTDYISWRKKTDEFTLEVQDMNTLENKIGVFQDDNVWSIELPDKAVPNYEVIRVKRI